MATADIQVKCFIIRQLVCVVGHTVDYYTSLCFYLFVYTFFHKKRKRVGRLLTLTDLIVETAEGEREGRQELWQDSIAGQRGHTVN